MKITWTPHEIFIEGYLKSIDGYVSNIVGHFCQWKSAFANKARQLDETEYLQQAIVHSCFSTQFCRFFAKLRHK
jgi:hypothetical protein